MSGQDEDRSSASGLRLAPAAATYDDFGMCAAGLASRSTSRLWSWTRRPSRTPRSVRRSAGPTIRG